VEECDAICRLRGLSADATAAAQLKAIDEEYHSLLEKGQSFKADHVQALYAWKSKQAAKVCCCRKASVELVEICFSRFNSVAFVGVSR